MGRDFGMTSGPTKAVAVGRRYHISYGGLQDLQYVGDVAATFVRALEHPFQEADAFSYRESPPWGRRNALCKTVRKSPV